MRLSLAFAVLLAALLGVSCSPAPDSPDRNHTLNLNPSNGEIKSKSKITIKKKDEFVTYHVTGKITELHPAESSVEIQHDEIPGYMKAMTMPFDVKDTNELTGLNPGDKVSFKLLVQAEDAWIENIHVTERAVTTSAPITNAAVIRMRDVEPVTMGDLLPEYHFTNEFGAPVSTTQFKGKALGVSFLFTRCPLPTFCPLMARNLAETQRRMTAIPNGPTNWHLLAVTIDPGYDTPAVLRDYGERFDCRTNTMSFLTGDMADIAAFGEQLGLTLSREPGSLPTHNLRTVVVDASGKIQSLIVGNKWTADELMQDLLKAAAVKP